MLIELKKHAHKPPTLSCTRSDGSVTWQSYGNHGGFFPFHDIAHFVVETELGYRNAFFGMIAAGRNLGDFGPGDAVKMHPEAMHAEMLVGLLTTAEANGTELPFADIKKTIDAKCDEIGIPPISLSEDQRKVIQSRCSDLSDKWKDLPFGAGLTLSFDV